MVLKWWLTSGCRFRRKRLLNLVSSSISGSLWALQAGSSSQLQLDLWVSCWPCLVSRVAGSPYSDSGSENSFIKLVVWFEVFWLWGKDLHTSRPEVIQIRYSLSWEVTLPSFISQVGMNIMVSCIVWCKVSVLLASWLRSLSVTPHAISDFVWFNSLPSAGVEISGSWMMRC